MSKGKKGRRGSSGDEIFVIRRLREAEAAVARGAWEDVRVAADAALRFDPSNETASRLLGLALRQLGLLSEQTSVAAARPPSAPPPATHMPTAPWPAAPQASRPMPAVDTARSGPLVARRAELAAVQDAWQAVTEGRPRTVVITGEPGIGTSRLAERAREVAGPHHAIVARCSRDRAGTAFHPLVAALTERWQLGGLTPAEAVARVRKEMAAVPEAPTGAVSLLLALLGLPASPRFDDPVLAPEAARRRTIDTLVAWLRVLAAEAPALVLVEDLHDADASTRALVDALVAGVTSGRLFVVLTSRARVSLPIPAGERLVPLTLGPLGDEEAKSLVRILAGGVVLDAAVQDAIVARAAGLPLAAEDLTRAVLEAPAPTADAVPAGLRESVVARLDARAGMREVAAALATLGDGRPPALLSRLTAVQGPALRAALDALAAARLVEPTPGGGCRFRHVRYREVAYAAQSEPARRAMHERIAELLEREHPQLVAEEPEMLAHHLAGAGRLDDSAALWCRAGVRERRRGSYAEAVAHLRRAEALLPEIPEGATRDHLELEILVTLGMSDAALRGFAAPEVAALHERAIEVARRVDAGPVLYAALDELWRFCYSRGDFTGALALAGLYRDTVRRTSELGRLSASYTSLGYTACQTGRLEEAREDLEVSLALYDAHARVPGTEIDAVDPGLTGGACLSTVLCLLGFLDQATRQLHATLERTETTEARGGTLTRVHVHVEAARMLTHRRDLDEAIAHARTAVAMANKLGYFSAAMLATLVLGVALAERGESAEALELLQPGIDQWRATGVELYRPHLLGALARAQADRGELDAALRGIEDALSHAGTFGERVYVAELHRLRGEILRAQGGAGAGEAFARALTTAQAQGARLFELRAAMSLHRLRLDAGAAPRAIKESRARVAELREAFGEGQDTADLRDAAALLETARGPAAGRVTPLE